MGPEILHFSQHPGDANGAAVSLVNLGLENIIVSLYHQPTQVHLSNYVSGYIILQAAFFTSRSTSKNVTHSFYYLHGNP